MAVVRKKWTKEEDEKILKEYKIKGAK